jgi:hypothetical protein
VLPVAQDRIPALVCAAPQSYTLQPSQGLGEKASVHGALPVHAVDTFQVGHGFAYLQRV